MQSYGGAGVPLVRVHTSGRICANLRIDFTAGLGQLPLFAPPLMHGRARTGEGCCCCPVLAVGACLTQAYVFGRPVSSLDSHRLSRCLISIKRRLHSEQSLLAAQQLETAARRFLMNCTAAQPRSLEGTTGTLAVGLIASHFK